MDLNGAAACSKVEVLVEKNSKALWKAKIEGGTVTTLAGDNFAEILGPVPADLEAGRLKALGAASHVHIAWPSTAGQAPLRLPGAASAQSAPQTGGRPLLRLLGAASAQGVPQTEAHLILIAKGKGVSGGPGPFNHAAEWMRRCLIQDDPDTPVIVQEVSSPIDYLKALGAFDNNPYRIKRLFSFSHGWEAGLQLEDPPQPSQWHDIDPLLNDIEDKLLVIYNDTVTVGSDDYSQVNPMQFRASNLSYLPGPYQDNLRTALAAVKGIYLIGCRTADATYTLNGRPTLCQVMADTIQQRVWGAQFNSKFYQWTDADGGTWVEYNALPTDPIPEDNPVVLIPATSSFSTVSYLFTKFKRGRGLSLPTVPDPPNQHQNLIAFYQSVLLPVDPRRTP